MNKSLRDVIDSKDLDSSSYIKKLLVEKQNSRIQFKKKFNTIRLHLEGGKASPAPPVGPALSQYKVKNLMGFCKDFNAATKDYPAGIKFPVDIFVFEDGSVEFKVLKMTVSDMIKQKAGIEKGSSKAGRESYVASISWSDVIEIAEHKFSDLNALSIEGAAKIIAGSARSMNVDIV